MSTKKIVDVSSHRGKINWAQASNEVEFCIARASIGLKEDEQYLANAAGCYTHGVPFAAFHYVKAGTAEEAIAEAKVFADVTSQTCRPLFYIADIEYETQTKSTTEAVSVAFLEELRRLGCKRVGLYIGQSRYPYAGRAIEMSDIIWIPRYGDKTDGTMPASKYEPKYPCDLWQYSSTGKVTGINGNVDLNVMYGGKTLDWLINGTKIQTKEATNVSNYVMTAAELVAKAIEVAKKFKTIYMYACYGFQVTDKTIASKAQQNLNSWYTSTRIATLKAVANQNPPTWGFDCVNLYKGLLWGWTGDESKEKGGAVYAANGVPDTNANGMFDRCTGKSADFSKIEVGEALWLEGHFGLYIGDGLAVECTPKWKNGVQITAVGNIGSKSGYNTRKWTKHGKLPFIDYSNTTSIPAVTYKLGERTLSKGDEGDDVAELQTALVKLGYNLGSYGVNKDGVDGDFGNKTLEAVKKVQAIASIDQTGTFDKATYDALMLLLAPPIINPEPESPPEPVEPSEPAVPEEPSGPADNDKPGEDEAPTHVLIIQGDADTLRKLMLAYGGTLAAIENVTVV